MRHWWGTARGRLMIFGVVVVLAVVATGAAFAKAVHDAHQRSRPTAATAADRALNLGTVLTAPHVLFRSTSPGPTSGMLAAVPLADPGGDRSVSDLPCARVYATADDGVCLAARSKALVSYQQTLLTGAGLSVGRQSPVSGIPSRARLSDDGTMLSTTVFVTGHSYSATGFSTETIITDLRTGHSYGNLETDFKVQIDPRRNHAVDLNIWGVTFAHGPRPTTFYATVYAGGLTWLAKGDLSTRTLTAIHPDAECPSLSPDGKLVVFKKRNGSPTRWRLNALDLATGRQWPLPETRSVDDQVEWLDAGHVLYALPTDTPNDSDIWVTDLRAGKPSIFIRHAESPAVVR